MKKYLLGMLILVLLGISIFYVIRNKGENPAIQKIENENKVEKVENSTNSNFKLNYNVEQIKTDGGFRTMVTYSVRVTGVESRSSGDWTLEINCPDGVLIGSVVGDQKCPTGAQRVITSLAYRFKNSTTIPQTVKATARLLSGKDNQTAIIADISEVIIPPSK